MILLWDLGFIVTSKIKVNYQDLHREYVEFGKGTWPTQMTSTLGRKQVVGWVRSLTSTDVMLNPWKKKQIGLFLKCNLSPLPPLVSVMLSFEHDIWMRPTCLCKVTISWKAHECMACPWNTSEPFLLQVGFVGMNLEADMSYARRHTEEYWRTSEIIYINLCY